MRTPIIILSVVTFIVILWNFTAYRDIEKLKQKAPEHLKELSFEVIGYNGYNGNFTYGGSVFYLAKTKETPNIVYEIEVVEWRGEIQSYIPQIVNKNLISQE